MDFNKAFLAYDTLDGALCQTSERRLSQREAALEAVKAVGLNQVREVEYEWFEDRVTWEMFCDRLAAVTAISERQSMI